MRKTALLIYLLLFTFIEVSAQTWYNYPVKKATRIGVLLKDTSVSTIRSTIQNALSINAYGVSFSATEGVNIATSPKPMGVAQQKITAVVLKTDSGYFAILSGTYLIGTNTLFTGSGAETIYKGQNGSILMKCWNDLIAVVDMIPGTKYYYLKQ